MAIRETYNMAKQKSWLNKSIYILAQLDGYP